MVNDVNTDNSTKLSRTKTPFTGNKLYIIIKSTNGAAMQSEHYKLQNVLYVNSCIIDKYHLFLGSCRCLIYNFCSWHDIA